MTLLIIVFLLIIIEITGAQNAEVTIPNGKLVGRLEYSLRKNVTFYAFQQIPYAKPPLGDLRFKEPQSADPWEGTLNATLPDTKVCWQVDEWGHFSGQTEDCLYLSVYTPKYPSSSDSYPVIFYIYGGGFTSGSANFNFTGPHYFMESEVIVVNINYRVGPFGFLSTEDDVVPGNNGLKDQNLALRWVRDNIRYFGGDPNKITIMGDSAGGASVTYHMLSEKSKGLFRAGIAFSGSALCPWSYQDQAKSLAYKLATTVDPSFNPNATSKQLASFLRKATAAQINSAAQTFKETVGNEQLVQGFFWAPVIEHNHKNAFIVKPMYGEIEGGRISNVPLLMGITSEEALDIVLDDSLSERLKSYDADVTTLVNRNMHENNYGIKRNIGKTIREIYTDGLFQNNLGAAIRYFSDMEFSKSVIRHAHMQSIYSDVYFYQFSYEGRLGDKFQPFPMVPGTKRVAHTTEQRYIWCSRNMSNLESLYPAQDIETSERFRLLLTNFVKYLNPTPKTEDLLQNIIWPKVENWNFTYLNINTTLKLATDPKKDVYGRWVYLYDSFGIRPFTTF